MAPTKYEELQLLEAGEDVRRPMSKGRIVGVLMAIVAVVGLVGASTLPKKPVSQMDRLSVARKALMKAFSKRSLQELVQTKARASFTARQEHLSIGDEGLSIHATVASDPDTSVEKPQVEVEFEAQEGKGEELEEAFKALVKAGMEAMQPPPEDEEGPERRRLEDGPFHIKREDDSVQITLIPPVDDNEDFASDLEEGMENVKFEASLKLGRTLDELYDDNNEHLPMSLHGLQFTVEAAFAGALCGAMTVASEEMGEPMVPPCDGLSALTQVNVSYDIRYRDPSEMSDEVQTAFPTLSEVMQMAAGPLMGMPDPLKEAMKKLDGLTKGIKSIAIRGLPNNFEIVFDCKNFKVSSVLKKLIELTEG